jgi:hypothetical protein
MAVYRKCKACGSENGVVSETPEFDHHCDQCGVDNDDQKAIDNYKCIKKSKGCKSMKEGDYIAVRNSECYEYYIRLFIRKTDSLYECVLKGDEENYRVGKPYSTDFWNSACEMKEFSHVERLVKLKEGELVAVWDEGDVMKVPAIFSCYDEDNFFGEYCVYGNDGDNENVTYCEKVSDPKNHDWNIEED